MIDAAGVEPGDRVLEIGAGSGYAAAVMSRIAERVVAIERHEELARLAAARTGPARLWQRADRPWRRLGAAGAEEAPYDAILAAASGSHVPRR